MKKFFIFLSLLNLNMIASQQAQPQSSWPIIRTCIGTISLFGGLFVTLKYGFHLGRLEKPKKPIKVALPKSAELIRYEKNIEHLQAIKRIAQNRYIQNDQRNKELQDEADKLDLQEDCENFEKVQTLITHNVRDIPTFIKDAFNLTQQERNSMERTLIRNDQTAKNKVRANYMVTRVENALRDQQRKKEPLEQEWQKEMDDKHAGRYGTYWEKHNHYSCTSKLHGVRAILGLAAAGAGSWLLIEKKK